jgi:hypothetical protein
VRRGADEHAGCAAARSLPLPTHQVSTAAFCPARALTAGSRTPEASPAPQIAKTLYRDTKHHARPRDNVSVGHACATTWAAAEVTAFVQPHASYDSNCLISTREHTALPLEHSAVSSNGNPMHLPVSLLDVNLEYRSFSYFPANIATFTSRCTQHLQTDMASYR